MGIELTIIDPFDKKAFIPPTEEGVIWSTERRCVPARLSFNVLSDGSFKLREGAAVSFKVNGKPVFYGYLFEQRHDQKGRISLTAYDQLRYLRNRDTFVYENRTASQLVKMLAEDLNLQTGTVEDTGFTIASRIEENSTFSDIIENALEITSENTGEMFVLYDDFGKLTLKNISSMHAGEPGKYLLIGPDSGEGYEYGSSIDKDVYNRVKLIRNNGKTGGRDIFIAEDNKSIAAWGLLQYTGKVSDAENGKDKAQRLLQLYNGKTRSLKIKNVFGDVRVRGGSMVMVNFNPGNFKIRNFMLTEKAVHIFKNNEHFMELTLRGGDTNG